ncbi:hypothetical protein DNTS_018868 [Danionella cerebrum]|uniref:Uncharacterized protein n=1 Tax=Danionella cerebrum TaxID=2873325 RepID=A0A553QET1_9TELE|nr:hypothetical protein DNTS_018868 [Danionella translucida]
MKEKDDFKAALGPRRTLIKLRFIIQESSSIWTQAIAAVALSADIPPDEGHTCINTHRTMRARRDR